MSVDKSHNKSRSGPAPINIRTFKKYLKKHGPERTQGYLDALVQMNENAISLLFHYDDDIKGFLPSSANRVRTKLDNFTDEIQFTLGRIEKLEILKSESTSELEKNTP